MTFTDTGADAVLLRPAGPEDAPAVAQVFLQARRAAVPAMPDMVHTDDETADHLAGRVRRGGMWVAVEGDAVVGFMDLDAGWLDALYLHPDHARRGIGSALLDLAKSLRPGGFALWVFESNTPARRFYERHGLVELEHTDGSTNEERAPDVRVAWPGNDPLSYFRAQIDEVDDELALLLARRAALTWAVQTVKPVAGHAGRDPERERAIARRMARRAPELGPQALERIMREVISASLDAAEPPGVQG